ncbi:relaxin-3 receptor 2 [Amia ocellicauda]|uniref:relaxin-3 receptor 2 n=1 Tax=Amia ocellicauda TaxID=2972642 RepID=UPI0034640835
MGLAVHKMARQDHLSTLHHLNTTLSACQSSPTCNLSEMGYHHYDTLEEVGLPGDGTPLLRSGVSIVYFLVCAAGLLGNLLVLVLLRPWRGGAAKSPIDFFVFNLALTDLQFCMVVPFWAVEVALDFRWPFGHVMCKLVSLTTVVNMYASVFFLTAMSITRYCSVATALQSSPPRVRGACGVKLATALIWSAAWLAGTPNIVYSTLADVGGDAVCLLRFPHGNFWLGMYHLQKIILGFLLPYCVILVSYLLLLHFLSQHNLSGLNPRRQSRVSRSVAVVVLAFFLCWLPNQAMTLWGVLIKLDVVDFDMAYYTAQTFVFPVTACLAHTNSCLNPVIYCLMRRDFREALKAILRSWVCRGRALGAGGGVRGKGRREGQFAVSSWPKSCLAGLSWSRNPPCSNSEPPLDSHRAIPLNNMDSSTKRYTLPSTTIIPLQRQSQEPLND